MSMGTPITRRRAYGPMRRPEDTQQTQQNQQTQQSQNAQQTEQNQNTQQSQQKQNANKTKNNESIYNKDSKGNPKITNKGKAKAEQGISNARKEADRDHENFMNDMFGDCY